VKISWQLCFSGQAQLAQNSECKKYVPYSGKFQANSVFQGKRNLLKILNVKICSIPWKISGQTLFIRASAICSKILKIKNKYSAQ